MWDVCFYHLLCGKLSFQRHQGICYLLSLRKLKIKLKDSNVINLLNCFKNYKLNDAAQVHTYMLIRALEWLSEQLYLRSRTLRSTVSSAARVYAVCVYSKPQDGELTRDAGPYIVGQDGLWRSIAVMVTGFKLTILMCSLICWSCNLVEALFVWGIINVEEVLL